jgi:hypothetical protein
MRARFVLPAIAMAAFLATLAVTGLPHHAAAAWYSPAPQLAAPTAPAQATPPPAPAVAAPVTASPATAQDSPVQAAQEAGIEAPQPLLPESSALPSYESDQASRNGHALGNARMQ